MDDLKVLLSLPLQLPSELGKFRSSLFKLIYRLYVKLAGAILRRYLQFKLRVAIQDVHTLGEFQQLAGALDLLSRNEEWKANPVSTLYDYQRIEYRLLNMRQLREARDIESLVHCLRQDLMKNLGGICDPKLYNISYIGTKHLIEEYHNEIIRCIEFIYYYNGN